MGGDERARHDNDEMVGVLIRQGAVVEHSPIDRAFRAVLRHQFLPGAPLDQVYADTAVVTHRGPDGVPLSSSSQPALMARMLQQLRVRPGHRVLEVGTGTGYNAAILGRLVGPEGWVTTVDVDPAICRAAERHLEAAGVHNVSVVTGDGWAAGGPGMFDRIEATVGVSDVSTAWVDRIEPDGILVAPLWLRAGLQVSVAFVKVGDGLQGASAEPCGFMRLQGLGAGEPVSHQVGAWTVSFDQPDADKAALLERLLEETPRSEPAPGLAPGWFTPIALCQPDAIHLFSLCPEGPAVGWGTLQMSPPALAVIVSRPGGVRTLETFGADQARQRLLGLIQEPSIGVEDLSVSAVPAGRQADEHEVLVTLARPNFTFVIRRT